MDVGCRRWPWRWLVTTRRPGIQWVKARLQMSESDLEQAFTQFGEAVAQLHAIQFAGFGELPPNLNLPAGRDFVAAWEQRAQAFIPEERLREAFLEALEPRKVLFAEAGPASLCHEDLHGYNLLFEPRAGGWQLSGVLDFDKAWAGCRESDLARLEFWDGMTSPAFWQAYTSNLGINSGYAQRKLLFQLFWCLEYGETSPRHQADTTRVCRELGIPEISIRQ
jgi:aminoglycoside phosphotransferase (APT) family kinase protein